MADVGQSLQEWNRQLTEHLILNDVILVLYLVFGTCGNILVIYIYAVKMRSELDDRYFIPVLAVSDLIACLIGCSAALLLNLYPVMYPSGKMCTALSTLSECGFLVSGLLTLAIALQRYLKVCHLGKQINLRWRRGILAVVLIVAMALTFPNIKFYGSVQIYHKRLNVSGYRCGTLETAGRWPRGPEDIYHSLTLIVGVIIIITLVAFYSMIIRTIYGQSKFNRKSSIVTRIWTSLKRKSDVTTDRRLTRRTNFNETNDKKSDQNRNIDNDLNCVTDQNNDSVRQTSPEVQLPEPRFDAATDRVFNKQNLSDFNETQSIQSGNDQDSNVDSDLICVACQNTDSVRRASSGGNVLPPEVHVQQSEVYVQPLGLQAKLPDTKLHMETHQSKLVLSNSSVSSNIIYPHSNTSLPKSANNTKSAKTTEHSKSIIDTEAVDNVRKTTWPTNIWRRVLLRKVSKAPITDDSVSVISSVDLSSSSRVPRDKRISTPSKLRLKQRKKNALQKLSRRYTFTFMAITLFYVLAFIPTLTVIYLHGADSTKFWIRGSVSMQSGLLFVRRFHLLSHVVNPFIYAAFDKRVRGELLKLKCIKC